MVLLFVVQAAILLTPQRASAATARCGYRAGPIFVDRGAGSGAFSVSLLPDVPGQSCTVSVAATAAITLPDGRRPSNVSSGGATGTVTVTFSPLLVAPRIAWQWRPFCADPSAVVFTATVGAVAESIAVTANSCQSYGGSSALLPPAPFPGQAQPAVTALAATRSGAGLWGAEGDGAVEAAGDAAVLGSAHSLAAPVVGMAATPDGGGYWLVASDGGVFTFGDARFLGSTGAMKLNEPVVGMAATPDGGGYWLVAADGGVFTFGDAAYEGAGASIGPSAPVTAITTTASGKGYWLLVEDGNVLSFGDAPSLAFSAGQ